MKIWKVYRWSYIGGILVAVLLIPSLNYFASRSFMPDMSRSHPVFALLSLVLAVVLLVVIGKTTSRCCPAQKGSQAITFGASGSIVSSLLVYLFIVSPTAGAYALHAVLPNGIHPIADEHLFQEKFLEIVTSIIWYSTISFWVSILLGAILGGLGGYIAKARISTKESPSMGVIPLSLLGLLYADFICVTPAFWFPFVRIVQGAASRLDKVVPNFFEISITLQILIPCTWLLFWQIANLNSLGNAVKYCKKQGISWAFSGLINFLSSLWQVLIFSSYSGKIRANSLFIIVYIVFILLSLLIGSLALRASTKIVKLPFSSFIFSLRSIKKHLPDMTMLGMLNSGLMFSIPSLNILVLAVGIIIPLQTMGTDVLISDLIKKNYLIQPIILPSIFILSFLFFKTTEISFGNLFDYIVRFRKEALTSMRKREKV